MIDTVLGWSGNVLLVWGYWEIGNKKRWAHLLGVLGELAWIVKSLRGGQYDLAVICAFFLFLAARCWVKWGQ